MRGAARLFLIDAMPHCIGRRPMKLRRSPPCIGENASAWSDSARSRTARPAHPAIPDPENARQKRRSVCDFCACPPPHLPYHHGERQGRMWGRSGLGSFELEQVKLTHLRHRRRDAIATALPDSRDLPPPSDLVSLQRRSFGTLPRILLRSSHVRLFKRDARVAGSGISCILEPRSGGARECDGPQTLISL
jgi:hypothetical protein